MTPVGEKGKEGIVVIKLISNSLYSAAHLECFITTFFLVTSDLLTLSFGFFFYFFGDSLWQDAENRVYIVKELDRITGQVMKQ